MNTSLETLNIKFPAGMTRPYDLVKLWAIPKGRFNPAHIKQKLTGYKPKQNQIVIFEGFNEWAVVLKEPTSTGSYPIKWPNGKLGREYINSKGIEGFVTL